MRFPQFDAFLAVAEELHFGRAAVKLGIAQPQLSELIRRLEASTGLALFERRPRVRLTPAGAIFAQAVARMRAEATRGIASARAVAAGRTGLVSLGFSTASMMTTLPIRLKEFMKEHPGIDVALSEDHSGPLREGLQSGKYDLIIGREAAEDPEMASVEAIPDRFMLLLPADHPMGRLASISLSSLENEPFILFKRSAAPRYYDRIIDAMRSKGLEPQVTYEVNSWAATLALVASGMGLSLGTALSSSIAPAAILFRALEEDIGPASFWLSWRRDRLSPAAERLKSHLLASLPLKEPEALTA
jgi:DNA-binding transcriptional LysR family regulator